MALVLFAIVPLGLGLFPQEPLRRLVEGTLRTAVGPESRVGYVHVTPFALRVEARDLRLEAPGFSMFVEQARAVALPRAVTELAILLRSLQVEGLTAVVHTAAAPGPAPGAGATALPPVLIEELTLRGGRIVWEDPGAGTLALAGVSARGALGQGTLSVEADRGELRHGTHAAFGPASGRVRVTRKLDATLEAFQAGFGSSHLTASGPLLEHAAFVPHLGFEARGAAVLLMNQELRTTTPWGLGAALFWDVGNVFPRVADVAFDFVNAVGVGLRWSSPVGLLRLDLGFPLDRGPEDKGYRIFFGLGQAF